MNDSLFLRAAEVAAICDVSIPKAYQDDGGGQH